MSQRKIPYLLTLPLVMLLVLVALRLHLPARLAALTGRTLRTTVGRELKTEYLAPGERAVLDEMNQARAHPQQYATLLVQLKQTSKGNQIKVGQKMITLQEGVGVLDEAIKFLQAALPLRPLNAAKGMCAGARDHVKDLGMSGNTGHKGTDGSLPEERIGRYGNWQTAVGENIAYNSGDAREAVIGMIIDDGVPTRGHRKNIFNPEFQVAGVALGQPSAYGLLCVVTYAGSYADKTEAAAYRR